MRNTREYSRERLCRYRWVAVRVFCVCSTRLEQFPNGSAAPDAGPLHRAAQVGTVISVVVIAVVALVGVLVLAQVESALPSISNTELSNTQTSILDGFAGAMDLIPVVLLVLVASLVIGIVQRLRSGGMA